MKEPINLDAERGKRATILTELHDAARHALRRNDFEGAERAIRKAEDLGKTPETRALRVLYEQAQIRAAAETGLDPFLRPATVYLVTGLGRTSIWKRVTEGTFPAPVSLGGHRIAWRQSEIKKWQAAQPTVSYAPTAA